MKRSGHRWPIWPLAAVCAALVARSGAHAQEEACAGCHGDRAMAASLAADSAGGARLFVDPAVFKSSVHGQVGFTCTMCHQSISDYPHARVIPVDCGGCHSAAKDELEGSVHGRVHPTAGTIPATCADCHGSHDIRRPADPQSAVYRLTQFQACAGCHSDREKMARFGQGGVEAVPTYLESVHGRALIQKGLSVAPVCTDCHGQPGTGAHEIQIVASPASPMNRAHVIETCGRCHQGIVTAFQRGIHGRTGSGDLSALPRTGGPQRPVRAPVGEARELPRLVPRDRAGVRPAHRRQLRELPRRARHPAVLRPRVVRGPRQPGRHLRAVSPRHRGRRDRREDSRRLGARGHQPVRLRRAVVLLPAHGRDHPLRGRHDRAGSVSAPRGRPAPAGARPCLSEACRRSRRPPGNRTRAISTAPW
ncbi:MAG: cytochrome c3 family protein [Gemmatimonadetes bacterium]|nr:cytochrome c3 family protein [Gemmatimonadota bacterium]